MTFKNIVPYARFCIILVHYKIVNIEEDEKIFIINMSHIKLNVKLYQINHTLRDYGQSEHRYSVSCTIHSLWVKLNEE